MADLICCGACNPTIAAVDGLVDIARQAQPQGINLILPLWDTAVLDGLHRLQHTPHTEVRPDVFACVLCGAVRRFGPGGRLPTPEWMRGVGV